MEDEEEGPPPDSDEAPISYADAAKHANGQKNQVIAINPKMMDGFIKSANP